MIIIFQYAVACVTIYFLRSFNVCRLSNTLSSNTTVNSCSIDVTNAILSKLSNPKSLFKCPFQSTYYKFIFSKCLRIFINLASTL